jgi:hypothetical protein
MIDAIDEFYDIMEEDTTADRHYIETLLIECGLMIVPIEDPTNLRFGEDE